MIWLTWRQFRTQAIVAGAALAALAIALAVTGPHLADLYGSSGLATCAAHGDCGSLASRFLAQVDASGGTYSTLFVIASGVALLAPAVIGVFWGAPLIAREVEAGTFRLAWNQSVTRTRWLAVKLVLLGLASMAAAGLCSLMLTWWVSPLNDAAGFSSSNFSRLPPLFFDTRGIAPLGYAAFAFALGVTAGLLIRRTVPAMAVTLAVFAAVMVIMPIWVRPHLIAPVRGVTAITPIQGFGYSSPGGRMAIQTDRLAIPGAWIYSSGQIVNAAGQVVEVPGQDSTITAPSVCKPTFPGGPDRCLAWIDNQHFRELVTYQPASRYWAFQWYETGIFLALALALAGFSFWQARRRLS